MSEQPSASAASLDVPYCWATFTPDGLEIHHDGDYRIAKFHAERDGNTVKRVRCDCPQSMTARQHREALNA